MSKSVYVLILAICLAGCAIFPAHPIITGSANFETTNDLDSALESLEKMHSNNGFRKAPFEAHTWHLSEGKNLAFHLGYRVDGKVLYVRLVSHNFDTAQTKEISSRIETYLSKFLPKGSFEFKYVEQISPFT